MKSSLRPTHQVNRAALIAALASAISLSACTKGSSFSLLADSQSFKQNAVTINNKIDILWVVDNSGSMDPYQQKLATNFSSFISNFQNKGFDFQMAVTTSDAYLGGSNFYNSQGRSQIRDGGLVNAQSRHTGYPIITPTTPGLLSAFVTNATQGSAGSGDERPFQSLVETLNNPKNASFKRPGSFLAVIILSDEDDFSDSIGAAANAFRSEGGGNDHDYNNANLMKTKDLISYLDGITASTATLKMYNVSAITVKDSTCKAAHVQSSVSTIIGQRYIDLATKTNGIIGDICDDSYANSLNYIQQRIVELSTQFVLSRTPDPATLSVSVAGQVVAQDSLNGWSYDVTNNSISFHGTAVPQASAAINVNFTPTSLK